MSRWRGRSRERPLFRTHEAPFPDSPNAVGAVVTWERKLYRVTRWEELVPTALHRGGRLREWQVWGRPLTDQEVEEAITEAAERLLEGGE